MPTAFTFVPSVQLLDFESLCPLIRHVSLIYGFCLLDQWFAIDFLQNLPHDRPLVFRLEVPAAGRTKRVTAGHSVACRPLALDSLFDRQFFPGPKAALLLPERLQTG